MLAIEITLTISKRQNDYYNIFILYATNNNDKLGPFY